MHNCEKVARISISNSEHHLFSNYGLDLPWPSSNSCQKHVEISGCFLWEVAESGGPFKKRDSGACEGTSLLG